MRKQTVRSSVAGAALVVVCALGCDQQASSNKNGSAAGAPAVGSGGNAAQAGGGSSGRNGGGTSSGDNGAQAGAAGGTQASAGSHGTPLDPGTAVQVQISTAQSALLGSVGTEVGATLTPQQFADKFAISFTPAVPYDATGATGMDLIQASPVGLNAAELAKLASNGFVISARQTYPSFVYGYQSLYAADLPVYVSADSILDAVHRSYDDLLEATERAQLIDDVRMMLKEMCGSLSAISDSQTRVDADFYLTVTSSLLEGSLQEPAAGASIADITEVLEMAQSAEGLKTLTLFGVERAEDFSQFKPRGHYTDDALLENYFRAMMWLGRIDFRLLETQPDGSQVFNRRQFDAMLAMDKLMTPVARARWNRLDAVIRAFVGESDYMTPPEVPDLLDDLGGEAAIPDLSNEQLAQAIIDGGYGQQLIASHIVFSGSATTLPLNLSFTLFGQRYVIDSQVLSNVVWDRVTAQRMMPNPLDVAFGALGNNQAGQMLSGEIAQYNYAAQLAGMRSVADHQPDGFWDVNLYNLWLSSLRALSPASAPDNTAAAGLPSVAKTEAWGHRVLNTQLGSWAELRHDTILYAKQSYTSGALCDFPDAYVDPYPEFFNSLARFADKGLEVAALLRGDGETAEAATLADRMETYLGELSQVVVTLGAMAQNERDGVPFSAEQLAFINETVGFKSSGCVPDGSTGWYARLFFNNGNSINYDPTIADVHTQPTDEGGSVVGRVLHVGTGMPRLMVVTTESCNGARAYAGLAFSYHETITSNFERLDDQSWRATAQQSPADVPWVADIVAQ